VIARAAVRHSIFFAGRFLTTSKRPNAYALNMPLDGMGRFDAEYPCALL
jgi:hypothetical protein